MKGPQYAIQSIFHRARWMAPYLLVFEDLDSLLTDKTRSYFLNEVDGLEANDGILMVGSTNHLDNLDSAIRDRPSRFDRKYYYPLPALAERASYARYWKAKLEKRAQEENSRVAAGIDFPDAACDFIAMLLTIARGGKGEEGLPPASTGTATPESGIVVQSAADEKEGGEEDAKAKEKKADGEKKEEEEEDSSDDEEEDSTELAKKLEIAKARLAAFAATEIPEDLRDNVLVKVIRQEIYVLLKEMDSNETK